MKKLTALIALAFVACLPGNASAQLFSQTKTSSVQTETTVQDATPPPVIVDAVPYAAPVPVCPGAAARFGYSTSYGSRFGAFNVGYGAGFGRFGAFGAYGTGFDAFALERLRLREAALRGGFAVGGRFGGVRVDVLPVGPRHFHSVDIVHAGPHGVRTVSTRHVH